MHTCCPPPCRRQQQRPPIVAGGSAVHRHRICCRRLPICRPVVCLTVPSPPSLEMGFRGSHGCPSSLAHRTAGRLHLRPPAAAVAGGDRPNLSWSPPAIIVTEEEDGFSAFGFSIFF
ncbi:hypothetical protein ACLOJK_015674 [Asimina triloba]